MGVTVLLDIHTCIQTHALEAKLPGCKVFTYSILIGNAKQILKLIVLLYTTTRIIKFLIAPHPCEDLPLSDFFILAILLGVGVSLHGFNLHFPLTVKVIIFSYSERTFGKPLSKDITQIHCHCPFLLIFFFF